MTRTTFQPDPPARVACRADGDRWTLVFVRVLRHPPEKVWGVLTDPVQLRAWAPFTADRDLGSVGGATLTMIDGDSTEDLAATVTRTERPRLLEHTWGSRALGTRRRRRRYAPHARAHRRDQGVGAQVCGRLAPLPRRRRARLLDGQPVEPIRGSEARNHGWDRLHDAYTEEFEIAGTGRDDDREAS